MWTSSNLCIGNGGIGMLTIEAGGTVNGDGTIANSSSSSGTVTVTGAGSKWTSPDLYVGYTGTGTLNIEAGGQVISDSGYIGYQSGASVATITGAGSTWTNTSSLYIGNHGSSGTLIIQAGGQVSDTTGYLGYSSTGTASVTGPGSQWTNGGSLYVGDSSNLIHTLTVADGGVVTAKTLYAPLNALLGNGTINTNGAVIDGDLVFDSTHHQGVAFGNGGTLTLNLDGSGDLGAGYQKTGTLTIADGSAVTSANGYLGYGTRSNGTATITGAGSKWTASNSLYVGYNGYGVLNVVVGGHVSDANGYLGYYDSPFTGTATVSGAGSQWTNSSNLYVGFDGQGILVVTTGGQVSDDNGYVGVNTGSNGGTAFVTGNGSMWTNNSSLYVGYDANGTLSITGGGTVTASSVYVRNVLAIDVATGSSLTVGNGSGTITNNGIVRILAGAAPAVNASYSPISASWGGGTGTVQAVGGTWNPTSHVFTASAVQPGISGTPVSADLFSVERLLISDSGSGWTLGASFAASATSKPLTLTATAISDGTLTALQNAAGADQTVLGGWTLAATSGYAAGDPAYLSFDAGGKYSPDFLQLWSYDGTSWTNFTANDVTYDGEYVNFTVTSMGCYAVTVPEPSVLALVGIGAFGLLAYGWQRK